MFIKNIVEKLTQDSLTKTIVRHSQLQSPNAGWAEDWRQDKRLVN